MMVQVLFKAGYANIMKEICQLDTRLANDTIFVGDLPLARMLLMNQAAFPWVILVPRVAGAVEVMDLTVQEQATLWQEVTQTAANLQQITGADKMNIATLGNVVKQLHMHVIARFEGDALWPNPVWGHPIEPYDQNAQEEIVTQLQKAFDF
jgi:diadenosine tetraphosphate (Ap4A) HIT family hydrolase